MPRTRKVAIKATTFTATATVADSSSLGSDDKPPSTDATLTPGRPRRAATLSTPATYVEEVSGSEAEDEAQEEEASPPKKARKSRKKAKQDDAYGGEDSDLTPVEELDAEEGAKPKKQRKKRAPKEPIVYDIPDVQTLPTTFKGRLGYACLNTILRNLRPARTSIFCSRTCRLDTIAQKGIDHCKQLGIQNSRDLKEMIEWNERHHIRFLRVSSEMFPFASHGEHGYDLEFADEVLKEAGDLANKYGHRLTTHPGQFNALGSPRKEVIDSTFRDLAYHAEMLERLRCGPDGVMIIHGGGVYGDKPAAMARMRENIMKLPKNVRDRLVLENDEMGYNADDLLPLCEELDIPLVFDYHHDWIFPSSIPPAEIIRRTNAIFARRGIRPKQHLSSPRPGAVTVMERRAHANRCETLPPDLPDDVDLMIEAKDKEQAVFHLYRIYQLHPVIHESLRPPDLNETLRTNGRKSHSPKKKKPKDEEGEEGVLEGDDGDEDLADPEVAEQARVAEEKAAAAVLDSTAGDGVDAKEDEGGKKGKGRKRGPGKKAVEEGKPAKKPRKSKGGDEADGEKKVVRRQSKKKAKAEVDPQAKAEAEEAVNLAVAEATKKLATA